MKLDIRLYLIRSQDGKYLRAKGCGGYGNSWVEEVSNAKVYTKLSTARTQVTFWATKYPEFGVPEILEIHSCEYRVMDEAERVDKAKEKIRTRKEKQEVRLAKWKLERAQKDFASAKKRLEEAVRT